MTPLSKDTFLELIASATIRPKLRRELRFVPDEITDWGSRDFLIVMNKPKSAGVLITSDLKGVIPFGFQMRKPGSRGRIEAIICDLCATWQRGTNSGIITFTRVDGTHMSLLCCGDLDCSLHVRDLTKAAKLSRTQLREDITPERRIERLQLRLNEVCSRLSAA